eukprot:CAMPEP_0117070440 /NCGR_PEP_ID=MMETSP0472-20121206/49489_1 /TAXON_ID=693140 ORGANISM="Tiarina fusus, Strain LIS" /NCGR_SAMPLE_ID=MMETSP0472 /ASSEMBLY_ACC=CAM_ASM_000603 /LENGTH=192 /DNA_ID=CAMNT_0004793549 /DNA_START=223 /DNA_END=798 /DNA_ORIENTATION=+
MREIVRTTLNKELLSLFIPQIQPRPLQKGKPNIIMFVGLCGSGTSSSIPKYARFYYEKKWKIGIVTGSSETDSNSDFIKETRKQISTLVEKKIEIIILDVCGRHNIESDLFEEMERVSAAINPDQIVYVMDGTANENIAFEKAQAFANRVDVGAVILTSLDHSISVGGAISGVAAANVPMLFLSSGSDDREW